MVFNFVIEGQFALTMIIWLVNSNRWNNNLKIKDEFYIIVLFNYMHNTFDNDLIDTVNFTKRSYIDQFCQSEYQRQQVINLIDNIQLRSVGYYDNAIESNIVVLSYLVGELIKIVNSYPLFKIQAEQLIEQIKNKIDLQIFDQILATAKKYIQIDITNVQLQDIQNTPNLIIIVMELVRKQYNELNKFNTLTIDQRIVQKKYQNKRFFIDLYKQLYNQNAKVFNSLQ